jgi:hypothetical protein
MDLELSIKKYKWIIILILGLVIYLIYKEIKLQNDINILESDNNRLEVKKTALKDSLKVITKIQTKYIDKIRIIKEREDEQIKVVSSFSNDELECFFSDRYDKDSIK